MKSSIGALASWINVAASFASFGLGLIILAMGGTGGADAIIAGAPLVLGAEALKILIGLCLSVQVRSLANLTKGLLPQLTGFVGALLMVVAGALGGTAILVPQTHAFASFVNPIALCGVIATGLWAMTSVLGAREHKTFPVWVKAIAFLLPISGLATLFMPAAGLAAFVLGILWNIRVAMILGSQVRGS